MRSVLCQIAALALLCTTVHAGTAFTIDDYNASLVKFGVPFYSRYPASFYTGFAMRVEEPKRIHFRAGRGNQVRLTAVLDEYSVLTYLYSLQKRYQVYAETESKGMFQTKSTEQLDAFRRIIDSPAYNIRGTLEDFQAGRMSKARFYRASLDILSALNPHRVFPISIDLKGAFLNWKALVQQFARDYEDDPADVDLIKQFLLNPDDTVVLSNRMLPGRINAVHLTEDQNQKLVEIFSLVLRNPSDEATFLRLARDYFTSITNGTYDIQTVIDGRFVPALRCEKAHDTCELTYPEFTAIYPNGSVVASAPDRKGNTIHKIRNNRLLTFIDRRYHDVDHIRREGYYGWAPKMDYEAIGNGIHNPGVSHYLPGARHLYTELDIPEQYQFLWAVSRGPVSHGCIRMAVGHLWEVRHIFPASPARLKRTLYFGNESADYDVFDIDGNGTAEVMGSQYYVAYSLQGPSGDAKRKGKNFSIAGVSKAEFLTNLYGEKGQFVQTGDTYTFANPHISYFRKGNAHEKQGAVISRQLQGSFVLYEQPYEKDKVQIYRLPSKFQQQLSIKDNFKSTGKQMVRVLGRISGCGPFKDGWSYCYENDFDREFKTLMGKL